MRKRGSPAGNGSRATCSVAGLGMSSRRTVWVPGVCGVFGKAIVAIVGEAVRRLSGRALRRADEEGRQRSEHHTQSKSGERAGPPPLGDLLRPAGGVSV